MSRLLECCRAGDSVDSPIFSAAGLERNSAISKREKQRGFAGVLYGFLYGSIWIYMVLYGFMIYLYWRSNLGWLDFLSVCIAASTDLRTQNTWFFLLPRRDCSSTSIPRVMPRSQGCFFLLLHAWDPSGPREPMNSGFAQICLCLVELRPTMSNAHIVSFSRLHPYGDGLSAIDDKWVWTLSGIPCKRIAHAKQLLVHLRSLQQARREL